MRRSPELIAFVCDHNCDRLVVQSRIDGGDNHIFDCYGLCNRNGGLVTIASHLRIRQNTPDRGITCYGEIPLRGIDREKTMFENTSRLLKLLPFHSIFGIEWLEDNRTGKLHLIDFNARPFSSIGHLQDSGLNLPYFYYQELLGTDISDQTLKPVLQHKYWVDLKGDIKSFRQHQRGDLSIGNWLLSLVRCRSFAFFRWHDLHPSLHIPWTMLQHVGSSALRRLGGQL